MVKEKAKGVNTHTTGKRKRAIARATFKPGKGIVKINKIPVNLMGNELARMRIEEPIIIAGDHAKKFDVAVNVKGGGIMGQADASRLAIAKGFVELVGNDLKDKFMAYDRYLLVSDSRRTEPHKSPRSSQGPRRYKQRSKR